MKIKKNIKLSKYTTFHIGGPARFFVEVVSVGGLREALSFADKNKLKIFVLGGGSNLLLPDKGINGLVIKMNIKGIKFRDDLLSVGAGEKWDGVVAKAVAKGLGGIENLSLVPGTVGGAVYQNIGAYGVELKDVLESVEVFDIRSQSIKIFSNKECRFGYRQSIFQQSKGSGYVVLLANLRLTKNPIPNLRYPDLAKYFSDAEPTLHEIRQAVIKIRKAKLVYPSVSIGTAGSFFKNPVIAQEQFDKILVRYPDIKGRGVGDGLIKLSAGQLIEKSGWKGKNIGKVGVSEKHALILVSRSGGRAKNVIKLANLISESVKDKFGVKLEPEVKIVA